MGSGAPGDAAVYLCRRDDPAEEDTTFFPENLLDRRQRAAAFFASISPQGNPD